MLSRGCAVAVLLLVARLVDTHDRLRCYRIGQQITNNCFLQESRLVSSDTAVQCKVWLILSLTTYQNGDIDETSSC
jgi:hypothetical protein